MNSKDIVLRIIQLGQSLPTFHVAKLAYLFDLACVQMYGEPKTDLPFKWHMYGPYCEELETVTWELLQEKKIRIDHIKTYRGYDCVLHYPVAKKPPYIEEKAGIILEYIVKHFSKLSTEDLTEFAYSTPPMIEAQQKKQKFKLLDMKNTKGIPEGLLDPDVIQMLIESDGNFENAISANEFFKELTTKTASTT